MRLTKLEELETIKPFDCGDSDLNGFLFENARFYKAEMIANTFVLENETETIAYFSLLNDKISQTMMDKNLWRKLRKRIPHEKHLGSYPAVKVGRLAVSVNHKGKGLGRELLDSIKQMLINHQSISAMRFLTVDAYLSAIPFYEKNGFRPLLNAPQGDTLPMYFDLKPLADSGT